MIYNHSGQLTQKDNLNLSANNRAFKYGDAVFDTLRFRNNQIELIEDHYFRLMSSMRMLRMKIPMDFTLEAYQKEILNTIKANNLEGGLARVRVTVYREDDGLYLPKNNGINYLIEVAELAINKKDVYTIELYKDYPVHSDLLSTLKTNNRLINVLASIYAEENDYDNCVLINEHKNVVEAINSNLFLIKDKLIKTPARQDGCIQGTVRKKVLSLLSNFKDYTVEESAISPFELLKADEVFLTNSIVGIQSVTNYRKKSYTTEVTSEIEALFEQSLI